MKYRAKVKPSFHKTVQTFRAIEAWRNATGYELCGYGWVGAEFVAHWRLMQKAK